VSTPSIGERLAGLERARRVRQLLGVAVVGAILLVTYFGLGFIGFEVQEVIDGVPGFIDFIGAFFPPDFTAFTLHTLDNGITGIDAIGASFSDLDHLIESFQSERVTLVKASIVTVLLGILGTVLRFPLALTCGGPSSARVVPLPSAAS